MTREALRLVVLDIDGCLTGGEASAWDLDVVSHIAALNRRARDSSRGFEVTLCSGRSPAYVEAVAQAIDVSLPAIFEHGAGLYFPAEYRFAFHPALTTQIVDALERVKKVLTHELVDSGIAQVQPGKERTISLHPVERDSISFEELGDRTRAALDGEPAARHFRVSASVSSVEVQPTGLHKGWGVEWVARETGIPPSAMGGIGDADGDVAYLRIVGRSAAPENATKSVKECVEYLSPFTFGRGVLDILKHWRDDA